MFAAISVRLVLIAIPFPYVPDVYYYDSQGVKALAAGVDPYGFAYTVPPALQTAGAANVFAYLPGVLVLLFPFGVLTDVRLGLVLCDILVAWGIYSLVGRRGPLGALVFLALPFTALFSTWYPNDTLVAMAFLGTSLALGQKRPATLSAVLFGFALASSQFVWIAYPFFLARDIALRRLREIAIGLAVAGAVVLPFFLWNPTAFVDNTLVFVTGRPVQGLVTPEPFGFNVNPTLSGLALTSLGLAVPLWLKAGIVLPVLVYLLWSMRSQERYLLGVSFFLLACIFVLPDDFSWWYLELPFQTLLLWFLVRGEPSEIPANA